MNANKLKSNRKQFRFVSIYKITTPALVKCYTKSSGKISSKHSGQQVVGRTPGCYLIVVHIYELSILRLASGTKSFPRTDGNRYFTASEAFRHFSLFSAENEHLKGQS